MEHLGWGLQMTVLGMGLVFTLLAILWALLKLVLVLDKGDEEEAPQATPQAPAEAAQSAVAEEAQAPAIPTVNGMAADLVAAIPIPPMRHKKTPPVGAPPIIRTGQPRGHASRWAAAGRVRQTNTWNPRGR